MKILEALKIESKENTLKSFDDKYDTKSFYDTYSSLNSTSKYIKIANNLVSLFFCFCFFSFVFKELNQYVCYGLSTLLTVGIEALKTLCIDSASDSYFKKSTKIFNILCIAVVGFLALSFATSWEGSKQFNESTSELVSNAELTASNEMDTKMNEINTRIADAESKAKNFFETNLVMVRGKQVLSANRKTKNTYSELTNEALRLQKVKDDISTTLGAKHSLEVTTATDKTHNISFYFICISVVNEFILIAVIVFMNWFSFTSYKEKKMMKKESTAVDNETNETYEPLTIPTEQIEGHQVSDILSNKIGFDISEKLDINDLNYLNKYPKIVTALMGGNSPYSVIKNKVGKQTTVYKVKDILKAIESNEVQLSN